MSKARCRATASCGLFQNFFSRLQNTFLLLRGQRSDLPAGPPHRRGRAAAVWEVVGRRCAWWCPGSRWQQTWRTCTLINPLHHRPQAEEEPHLDPPPPARDGSAPDPVKKTVNSCLLKFPEVFQILQIFQLQKSLKSITASQKHALLQHCYWKQVILFREKIYLTHSYLSKAAISLDLVISNNLK